MANRVQKMLNERYERKQRTMFARVTEIPQSDGRSLGYVVCEIGGNAGISVRITDPNLKYYVGDTLQVTEVGTPANASYFASGFIAGPRPTSGMYEFTDSIALAEHEYSPGDILFGDPYGPNWMFDYAAGDMYLRTANQVNGIIYNDGVIELGPASGVHTRFRSDGFVVWSGEQILSAWDGLGRTVYGIETWGRPHGPGIQTKEFVDDEGNQRYGMQIIGFNGVPGISLLTGTLSNPEDYRFYIGLPSASAHMEYEGGDITLTGRVYQSGGNLDGIIGIGNYGGIWQGSGSMSGSEVGSGSPDTGLRIWAENGVGRLTTYKSGSVQVELDTEGQLLWAAGQGVANASGMTLSATIPDMFVTPLGGIGIAENYIRNTNIIAGWEALYAGTSAMGDDTYAIDFNPVIAADWIRISASSYGDRFGFWVRNLEGWEGKIRWGISQSNFTDDPFTGGENASALVSPSVWTYVEANIPSASWLAAASAPIYYYVATDGLDSTELFEIKNPHAYTSLGDVSPNFLKTAGHARSVDGIWATGHRPLVVTASTLGLDIVSSASGARIFATSGIGLEISTSLNDYGQKITSGSGLIAYSPYGDYIHINPGENITLYPSRRIIGVADAVSGSDAISLSFGDARYAAASSVGGPAGSMAASSVLNNTASFGSILAASHTSVQLALDALDDHLHSIYAPSGSGVTGGNTHAHTGSAGAQIDHGGLAGLGDDDHSIYALLAGRSGGQTLTGGSAVTDALSLRGTSGNGTATAKAIRALVGNAGATEALTILNNGNVGINKVDPTHRFMVYNSATAFAAYIEQSYQPSGGGVSIGLYNVAKWNGGNGLLYGTLSYARQTSSSAASDLIGGMFIMDSDGAGTGTVTRGTGGYFAAKANSGMSTTTAKAGDFHLEANGASSVMGSGYGVYVTAPAILNSGSITNAYGLYIEDILGAGTRNAAIQTNAGLVVINEGGNADADVRVEGDTDQFLLFTDAGVDRVGIGTGTVSTKLHVNLNDSGTDAITNVMTVARASSGTPAAGFGAGQIFTLESSTTAEQSAALLAASWIVATHASRTARLTLSAYDYNGAREGIRIDTDGSAPLLGFYAHAATAQQVLATGAGRTVDDVITALQALGLVKQS